jgi:diketogulonate reductase-like aldo/keto reductase
MIEIPVKKLKCGFELPAFGFGTWRMGGIETPDPLNDDRIDIFAIKTAIEMGVTHIDTAEFYTGGHTEEIIAEAIKDFDRSKIIITTKASPQHLHYKDLINAAQQSLKRLKTDYIDIYAIHIPNPYISIKETMEAMDYLVEKQLIRYIGLSNFNVEQFSEAQKCTGNKIVCNHVHYNLMFRLPQKDGSIEYAQKNDIIIVAWRPVQKGLFLEKNIQILDRICKKYEKTPNQIAINWLISQKNVTTISKTRNIKHLEENLGAISWKMEEEDIKLIMENFPDLQYMSDVKWLADTILPE